MAYGFKAENYSKRLVSETAVYQVAMASDLTVSGIGMMSLSAGAVKVDLQGEDLIAKDLGAVKVKKTGLYRVSAEMDIASVDSGVTFVDAIVTTAGAGSGARVKGTIAGAGGTFVGTMTAGPKIVRLEANDRLMLYLNRRGSGSVTAKGTTSNITVEWVGPAE